MRSEYKSSIRCDDIGDEGGFEIGDDGMLTLAAADASGSEVYMCEGIEELVVLDPISEICPASCLANSFLSSEALLSWDGSGTKLSLGMSIRLK